MKTEKEREASEQPQEQGKQLAEILRARELGILPWSHLSNPTQRFEIARDTIDYLLTLLQQPATSERCGECGHTRAAWDNSGVCGFVDPNAEQIPCGHHCVFPATEAPDDLVSRQSVVERIERQIRLWNNDTVTMACADMLAEIKSMVATTGAGTEQDERYKMDDTDRPADCNCISTFKDHRHHTSDCPVYKRGLAAPATVAEAEAQWEDDDMFVGNGMLVGRCDYRYEGCASQGVTVGGQWVCNNHLSPAPAPVQPVAAGQDDDLLTTLKAAANYICRANSDYYSEDVRDTIIRALTHHINQPSTATPGEGAREAARRVACEIVHRHVPLTVQLPQGINGLEDAIVDALCHFLPTEATQVAVGDAHGDTQQFFDRLLADSRQWLDEKFTKGWSAGEAAKEIRAEFKRKFVIPTEQELVAIISKYCPADAGGVERLEGYKRLLKSAEDLADKLNAENDHLRAELSTARADAIRECVSEVADVFRSVKATYIPVNRAMEITATALELLSEESLTTKEGDDGPSQD
jgi:hypothetical protein